METNWNKRTAKILAISLMFAMMAAFLPQMAFADDTPAGDDVVYDLWVGGTQVTSANCEDIPAAEGYAEYSGKASYDDSTKTLTLDGYSYRGPGGGTDQSGVGHSIEYGPYDRLTIVLKGTNNLTTTGIGDNGCSYGICCGNGSLTVEGDGTLNVTAADTSATGSADYSDGISIGGNNFTIKSGTVNAKGGKGVRSRGINCYYGTVKIEGGKVTAAGDAADDDSYGIDCDGGRLIIGSDADSVEASGKTSAVIGKVSNARKGKGWTDADGTEGEEVIDISETARELKNADDAAYKKVLFERKPISYKVTFKVVNGAWNDGEGEDAADNREVTLTGYEGDTLKVAEDQIPAAGSKPDSAHAEGNWDVTPDADTAITEDTTYTYTYAALALVPGTGALAQNANTKDAQILRFGGNAWYVTAYDGKDGNGILQYTTADGQETALYPEGTVTLLSKSDTGYGSYNPSWTGTSEYSSSAIRDALDGETGVWSRLSTGEQNAVLARILTGGEATYGGDLDYYGNGITGDDMDAHIWPLSCAEANALSEDIRKAYNYDWWLRTPGINVNNAAFVEGGTGTINRVGEQVWNGPFNDYHCAFYLDMSKILFTSEASGGKSSGTTGADALEVQSDRINSGNEWKVTVQDSAHEGFAITGVEHAEKGVSITYKGAATGSNEYISAIVTDKPITSADARITYYGRILNCVSDDDASGKVTVNTEGKIGSSDHLYVFSEQCGEDNTTDYASELKKVNIPKPISYRVTFKAVNGAWDDGTTADKTVILTGYEGETLNLSQRQIPAAGGKPDDGYKEGSWDAAPDTRTSITHNTTYTYTYAGKDAVGAKVTFRVVNGSWTEGEGEEATADREVMLTGFEGDELKLTEDQIPAAGGRPDGGYQEGGWDVTPDTETAVTEDTVYTYTYAKAPAPAVKVSGTLMAKMTSKGKNRLVFKWSKIKGAEGYDVFLVKGRKTPKKVKTIIGSKTLKWTKKGLKKKTAYKAFVKAYVMRDGKKTYVKMSPAVYAYTSGGTKKYTNAKSVTVKKAKVSLKAGKTYKIKAAVKKLKKNSKLIPSGFAPKLRYLSSNNKIASVNRKGKIKAKAKGTCRIYVYAANGVWKTVRVTVK